MAHKIPKESNAAEDKSEFVKKGKRMMRLHVMGLVSILSVLLGVGAIRAAMADTSPSPSASASAASVQSTGADTAARAKDWLHRFQTGDIDRSQLNEKMNAVLTPDVIKQISEKYAPLGDPESFTPLGQQSVPVDMTAYVYRVVFKTATLNEVFVLDRDGKVAGIQFPPAQ